MPKAGSVPSKMTAPQKLLLDLKYREQWIERRAQRPFPAYHALFAMKRGTDDGFSPIKLKDIGDAMVEKLVAAGFIKGHAADLLWDVVRFELTEQGDREAERLRNLEAKHAR